MHAVPLRRRPARPAGGPPAGGHGVLAEHREPGARGHVRDAGLLAPLRPARRHRAEEHGRGAGRRDDPRGHVREHGAPGRGPLDLRPADGPLPDGAARRPRDARGPRGHDGRPVRARVDERDRGRPRLHWKPVGTGGFATGALGDDGLQREEVYQGYSAIGGSRFAADGDWSHSSGNGTVDFGDFHFDRADARLQYVAPGSQTDLFAGYQASFFGWPNLYTPFDSDETENLQTVLVALNSRAELGPASSSRGAFSTGATRTTTPLTGSRRSGPSTPTSTRPGSTAPRSAAARSTTA
jgi:hypothetical protein